jgi:hypothetical protein
MAIRVADVTPEVKMELETRPMEPKYRLTDNDAKHRDEAGNECPGREFEMMRTDPKRIDLEGRGGNEARCATCLREFAVIEGRIQVDLFE